MLLSVLGNRVTTTPPGRRRPRGPPRRVDALDWVSPSPVLLDSPTLQIRPVPIALDGAPHLRSLVPRQKAVLRNHHE